MIERRKISEGALETEQSLEPRVIAALTSDDMPSGDLEMLIGEIEAAVAAFDIAAREEHALALDILAAPDANAARERAVLAELHRDRLRNAIPQLQAKQAAALRVEYHEKWLSKYRRVEAKRDAAAEKFARYPELAGEIRELLQSAEEVDREVSEVNGSAPDGEHRRLAKVSDPRISNNLVLPCWEQSGRNIWPTRTSGQAAAEFAQSMAAHSYYAGADWWRLEEQKATERRAEAERMNRHYEQMTREQEERINKEERERFLARQRA
jgi:hypothetical protein